MPDSQDSFRVILENIREKQDATHAEVRTINHFINGNGQPGVKVRLDRLEQFKKQAIWVVSALIGGATLSFGGIQIWGG